MLTIQTLLHLVGFVVAHAEAISEIDKCGASVAHVLTCVLPPHIGCVPAAAAPKKHVLKHPLNDVPNV